MKISHKDRRGAGQFCPHHLCQRKMKRIQLLQKGQRSIRMEHEMRLMAYNLSFYHDHFFLNPNFTPLVSRANEAISLPVTCTLPFTSTYAIYGRV